MGSNIGLTLDYNHITEQFCESININCKSEYNLVVGKIDLKQFRVSKFKILAGILLIKHDAVKIASPQRYCRIFIENMMAHAT